MSDRWGQVESRAEWLALDLCIRRARCLLPPDCDHPACNPRTDQHGPHED